MCVFVDRVNMSSAIRKRKRSETNKQNAELNPNIFLEQPSHDSNKKSDQVRDEKMKDLEASLETYAFLEYGPSWVYDPEGKEWDKATRDVKPKRCWYDGEPFDTRPVGMPISRINKWRGNKADVKFRVIGCFCGFSCMKAYNHYEFSKKHDVTYRRRMDMIHEMYIRFRKSNGLKVLTEEGDRFLRTDSKVTLHLCSMAPPRQLLLSGRMTLDQFRKDQAVQYEQLMPPCIGIKLHVEEYKNKLEAYKRQKVREQKFELPEKKPAHSETPASHGTNNPDGKTFNIMNDLKLSRKPITTSTLKKPTRRKAPE